MSMQQDYINCVGYFFRLFGKPIVPELRLWSQLVHLAGSTDRFAPEAKAFRKKENNKSLLVLLMLGRNPATVDGRNPAPVDR